MPKVKEQKCPWCSRPAPVSDKGLLLSHVNAGGLKCYAVGMQVEKSTRTPPKQYKGTVQRNSKRKRTP